MTVICMDCHHFLSEKCPKCGAVCELTVRADMDGLGMRAYSICPTAGCPSTLLRLGEGGVSHGLCPGCLARRRAGLKLQIQDPGFEMHTSALLGATR